MLKFRLAALAAALVLPASLALTPPAIGQQKTTIGVSLAQDDNPFYIAMLRGIRARAQELGWEVATVSANEDKLKQINGVQDLVAKGVKGILISPIDAVGVNAAYDAAAQGKVPIVSVARGSSSPNQTIHVAMDEKQIGRDIAEWTAETLGGPPGDIAADLLLVHRHVDGLVGRRRAARHRDDRDFPLRRRVVGGVHADGVDRRNEDAFDALGDEVLHAVDLLDLVLVGGDRRDLPAELLRAGADAAQHGDVERVVVLSERDADRDLLLRRRRRTGKQRRDDQRCGE